MPRPHVVEAMGFSISSLSRTEMRCVKPLVSSQSPRRYQPAPNYNYKWTEVHYEASRGNLDKLRALLLTMDTEQIDRKDYYGKTPLYWAAYKGQRSSVELLLTHGADVNARCDRGATPLHAAVGLFPDCALVLIQVPRAPALTPCSLAQRYSTPRAAGTARYTA
ncbi:poly [ADP-ribose] polymerase tankyrase-1-like [Conger conger]|uniref:poly [ADP-ribose] polymerase tankyrase-1-like n=1 Tax=Conger conger TaxID=82655 RepID=UPI002A5AA156|nr:poly [ADP-ribose] polymerase tankyrase-1-like [Conger conger]